VNTINKLALGTAQFGLNYGIANQVGVVCSGEVSSILALAKNANIDTLDTAIAYGDSEQSLGRAGINGFKVISKLPEMPKNISSIEKWVFEQTESSLIKLCTNKLHGLLLHKPSQLISSNQGPPLYQALQKLKRENLVEKIGISVYSPSELDLIIPQHQFDIVQAPLNLIDRRLVSSGWSKKLWSLGTEIHSRSSFLQGLLLMRSFEIPHKFFRWKTLFQNWHKYLIEKNLSAIEACLAYQFSIPEIHRVILGVDSSEQLKQIIKLDNRNLLSSLPDITSNDELLINPVNWSSL
jgi:hypothetical protein